MEEYKSRVYALVDEENRVTRLEGEYTLPADLTGWILVEEGAPCDRLNLAQTHYLDKPLYEERGICQYKWNSTEIVERTQAEIDADYVEPVPILNETERLTNLESAFEALLKGETE